MQPFQRTVLSWYHKHGRKLPWRETQDPYRILVSEFMLQQTQVDRVLPKYTLFVERFPTLQSLALASPADVLRLWSGLGYNRRALYLQKCAQALIEKKEFPEELPELQKLPGLGPYTAAAILSFAFNFDVVVIDVNIALLYKRIFYPRHDVEVLAQENLPGGRSRDWHNALMDLGSLYCHRKNPDCSHCPIEKLCASAGDEIKIASTGGKKNVQAFKSSDRIVRGGILKLLMKNDGLSVNMIFRALELQGIQRDKEHFQKIVQKLEEDGLIERKNDKISLPRS